MSLADKEARLTKQQVDEVLDYDPETGQFTWKIGRRQVGGKKAGGAVTGGYLRINIDGVPHRAHRLAWLITYGCWPTHHIDHIDGQRTNNRIANLREANAAQNCINRPAIGYSFCTREKRYRTSIQVNRKFVWLGYFGTPEEALAAYRQARLKYFGEDFAVPRQSCAAPLLRRVSC